MNTGGASVLPAGHESGNLTVELVRLDEHFSAARPVGLLKVDVEGRQDDVLRGPERLLERKLVRYLFFEITRETPLPCEMTCWLQAIGYTCFVIDSELHGPKLRDVVPGAAHVVGNPTNLLATIDPDRALRLVAPRGWQCLAQSK